MQLIVRTVLAPHQVQTPTATLIVAQRVSARVISMSFRLPLLAAILACACLAPGAVAAVPSEHGLALATTPELIAAAVARGEISRAAGLRYLARSFAPDPQALPERLRGGIPSDGTIPLLQLRRGSQVGVRAHVPPG